jgi:hypothetical protein
MKGTLDHHCFCIPITCGKDDCPPWCLIELQGELDVQEDSDSATFPVGTLCQSSFVSHQAYELRAASLLADTHLWTILPAER